MIGWQQITDATQKDTIFDIGHNEVHNYGMGTLSDFGGVYLSSADNLCFQKEPPLCHLPTLVHDNYIHDCRRYNYGCQGIYMVSRSLTGLTDSRWLTLRIAEGRTSKSRA